MELEKDLLDFARHIVKMKRQYSQKENKYVYAGKYTVTVYNVVGYDKRLMIRVGMDTGQVQVKKDLLAFSDFGVFFWIVWGLIRIKAEDEAGADVVALAAALAEYRTATNNEINAFYLEYNRIMELCPTEKNLKRSEYVFDKISTKLINNLAGEI